MFQGLSQEILAGNVGSDLRRFPESVIRIFLGKTEIACGIAIHCEILGISQLTGWDFGGVVGRVLSAPRRVRRPSSYRFLVVCSDSALEWERACCCLDMCERKVW